MNLFRFLAGIAALTLFSTIAGAAEPPRFNGMLAAHNAVRTPLGLPPLSWSPVAAAQAQGWADMLAAQGCAARYNPDPVRRQQYGENVLRAYAAEPYDGTLRQPAEVVARWAAEGAQYDHVAHRCKTTQGTQCGQYLQLIWETTEVVGCGFARCPASEVWVCNYTPRGGQADRKPYGNAEPLPTPVPVPAPVAQSCESAGDFDFEAALDAALADSPPVPEAPAGATTP